MAKTTVVFAVESHLGRFPEVHTWQTQFRALKAYFDHDDAILKLSDLID